MESLSPINQSAADCHFYYYSSCSKGNSCSFRHEPSALGNETLCVYWLKGCCNKPHCIYRHRQITKNQSKIPCFFESQRGGCKKSHCPFFHNDVQNQPRIDAPNNPDLRFSVKPSVSKYLRLNGPNHPFVWKSSNGHSHDGFKEVQRQEGNSLGSSMLRKTSSRIKRPHSPIRFDSNSAKKLKLQKAPSLSFSPKKSSLRKIIKSSNNNKFQFYKSNLTEITKSSNKCEPTTRKINKCKDSQRTSYIRTNTELKNNSQDSMKINCNKINTGYVKKFKVSINNKSTITSTTTATCTPVTTTPSPIKCKESSKNLLEMHSSRLDICTDEEELLLLYEGDSLDIDVDDIDEEELLS